MRTYTSGVTPPSPCTQLYTLWMTSPNHQFRKCLMDGPLKLDSHLPKKFTFICFDESPLKMMKNDFYFILKFFFVLNIFKSLSWLIWSCRKKGLIGNIRLISRLWHRNFMTSQLQYTYSPVSHEAKATRQWNLVSQYNLKNIFLQKSCRKWDREASSRFIFVF